MSLLSRSKRSCALSSLLLSRFHSLCTRPSRVVVEAADKSRTESVSINRMDNSNTAGNHFSTNFHLSPLFSSATPPTGGYNIELVDPDAWQVSSGLALAWRGADSSSAQWEGRSVDIREEDVDDGDEIGTADFQGFDEIEDMRIRGDLFYKMDKGSKEYEEYSLAFHMKRKKNNKNKESPKKKKTNEEPKQKAAFGSNKSTKNKESPKNKKTNEEPTQYAAFGSDKSTKIIASSFEQLPKSIRDKYAPMGETLPLGKNIRSPSFNQRTAPYHEPFCLDIYISKASVRACIIHRATSKVVAVAHSISKDMKFDLVSTRNFAACAAVGAALAQRALADDIHDVVYTPRKDEKLEGKLKTVLGSVIDNGINVKVKLKQRRAKTSSQIPSDTVYSYY